MVVVFFISTTAIKLLAIAGVFRATSLVLGVAMIIHGCRVVGIAGNNLVSWCVAVIISDCLIQAVAATTIGTGFVVAVRIIASWMVVLVW